MRLEDGATYYEGRVELCYDGEWGTVCDDGITDSIAMVVCKQLGLPLHGLSGFIFGHITFGRMTDSAFQRSNYACIYC